jgi:hypothetical protein
MFFAAKTVAQNYPFRKTDKGPKGTYVLYDQLVQLYPDASIEINHSSPSSKFKYNYQQSQGYFIVSPVVNFMDSELEALKRFVNNGNVLFISTYFPDEGINEWLGVTVERNINDKDSLSVFDFDKDEFADFYLGGMLNAFITKYDSTAPNVQVLGRYRNKVNCISFRIGEGYVVLHTQPFMLSNYHLIKKNTKAYSAILFSSLPGPLNTIYWDEYTKGTSNSETAPLKFLMSQPPLKNAFIWALAGLILLVLFSFKRRQRVIPLTEPLVNNSLDMARTVSDMYYFGKRNEVMAKKKIAHWFEFLRTRYNIFTSLPPEMFWQAVQMRSGMPEDQIAGLKEMVSLYRNGENRISDIDLIRLNNRIDSFYKS